jgi:hypothetical protein
MLFLFHSSLLQLLRQGKTLRAATLFINAYLQKTAQCHIIRTARWQTCPNPEIGRLPANPRHQPR